MLQKHYFASSKKNTFRINFLLFWCNFNNHCFLKGASQEDNDDFGFDQDDLQRAMKESMEQFQKETTPTDANSSTNSNTLI